jgi:ubiquitin conjugation factor E4 B
VHALDYPDNSRNLGPAELLPILLALTPSTSPGDPLTTKTTSTPIDPSDLGLFLNDLSAYTDQPIGEILSPTFSLFFQQWFGITPTPDIMGDEWRQYLGAVAALIQVKAIAAMVRHAQMPG